MATRSAKRARRPRQKTIFFEPRLRDLAAMISIESPAAFGRGIQTIKKTSIGALEKRALVLAQDRAKAMLKKRSLSEKERRKLQQIASMPLPEVTKPRAKKTA